MTIDKTNPGVIMDDVKATEEHDEGGDGISEAEAQVSPDDEKRLVRKCDKHVLPCITLLFFLAFLDRTNIGNAKIQGMMKDLDMTNRDYNIALFIFFVPYVLFEVPSNIIIRRLKPSTWLSGITTVWGIITMAQGLVRNHAGLVGMRFLLGLVEAGLFPGCIYLISMYYQRYELQWRMSLFFSASIIAGGVSGLLAFGIANMGGVGGYSAWRWIFILEGLATTVIGVVSKLAVPDWPETAKFLTPDEQRRVVARVMEGHEEAKMDRLDKHAWRRIVRDWKIYAGTLAYFGVVNSGYSGSFFIPSILNQMGYKAEIAQARSIPIFVVAAVCQLTAGWLTDRMRHRYGFTMFGISVSSIGYILLLNQRSPEVTVGVRYFALFLVVSGGYITQPITLAWLANNIGGHYKRSVSSATQIGFGNLGGIVASFIFFSPPYYTVGYATSLGMLWVCGAACTILAVGVTWENRIRDRGGRDYRYSDPDVDNMGDDHPSFRFTI